MFTLHSGDKVGITSLGSFINPHDIDNGINYLTQLGLIPVLGKCTYGSWRYMAGTPQDRAQDLNNFFQDKSIKAIFTPRGGGGTSYILPYIDYEQAKHNPKPIFGLSDITAVQNALYAQSNIVSYTGFLLKYDFKTPNLDALIAESLNNIFSGQETIYHGGECIRSGQAEAPLIGGNLSVLQYLLGTPYMPSLAGKILLLEDVGGKSYQVDLRLQQLKQQADFKYLKGIIFGSFTDCQVFDKEDGTIDEIIDYFCKDLSIPVIKNFPYGHIPSRRVLPIGQTITLDAQNCTIKF